jgi:MFS family permease
LILTDLLRAGTVLGFLLVDTPSEIWFLYLLTAFQLALGGIFFPTRTAILPDVVSPQELGTANTLSGVTWSTMLAVGAALGGVVAGEWGLRPAFVIDSLSFLLSAFFIIKVQYRFSQEPSIDGGHGLNFISDYVDGLRYLNANRYVISIVLQKASLVLSVTSIFQIIQVAISSQIFVMGEGGSTSLGLIYAMVGVGTGIGPIIARKFTGDNPLSLRRANLIGFIFAAIGLLFISPLLNFGLVLFGTLLRGIGAGLVWVLSTQLLLQLVPNQVRGRVFSTEFALMTLMSASGAALGGWIFDSTSISISQMLQIMAGAALLICTIWIAMGYLRSITAKPEQSETVLEALD